MLLLDYARQVLTGAGFFVRDLGQSLDIHSLQASRGSHRYTHIATIWSLDTAWYLFWPGSPGEICRYMIDTVDPRAESDLISLMESRREAVDRRQTGEPESDDA